MHNIFRVPVDNQHFKDTIEEGQHLESLKNFLNREEQVRLPQIAKNGIIKCWGSIPGTSNDRNFAKLKEGDELLCYRSGQYIALATIAFKTINFELAKHLWGVTESGKTWELMYFFKDVQTFRINASVINKEFGFKGNTVMGFNSIREEIAKKFITKFGSITKFVGSIATDQKLEAKIADEIQKAKINSPYEAQYYLVDLGNKLEYDTYVPASDAGRKAFDRKLLELATVRANDLRDYVAPIVFDPMSNIDVIWFKENYQPKYFFEVIHKYGWSEAFLRLDLATKHYEGAKARIIGTKENEEGYKNAIRKWSGPKDNFSYRDYDKLISLHSETLYHNRLLSDFL